MLRGIASIIFLTAAIATFFALSHPLYNEIKDINIQRSSFEEALFNSKQVQETRDKTLSLYNKISKENIERLNKIIPFQPGSMKFLLETESIAQKNGMILKNIDIKEKEKSETSEIITGSEDRAWETIPFSIKIGGSYKSFYSFLKDTEKNLRLTDFNALAFSAGETDFYEFDIEGSFYGGNLDNQNKQIAGAQDILGVLSLLKTIKLDLGFFDSPVFKNLYDFSVQLPVSEPGKDNPFAP